MSSNKFTNKFYGKCLRFNSGRSNDGTSLPVKYINNRGRELGLALLINAEIIPLIWLSNETLSLEEGTLITPKTNNFLKLQKYTITKQPYPYSSCLNGLTSIDSYNSECYRKTLLSSNNTSYHYNLCINMCRQKYLAENCQFQVTFLGPAFFDDIFFTSIWSLKDFKCLFKYLNPPGEYFSHCDCPIECVKYGYTFTHSETPRDPRYSELIAIGDNNNNNTIMFIFYDEMTELIVSEQVKTTVIDLISNIGGTLR